jgi:hypothetical protein
MQDEKEFDYPGLNSNFTFGRYRRIIVKAGKINGPT